MKENEKKRQELVDSLEEKKVNLENTYEEIVDKLHNEKAKIQNDIRQEYRNARRYVRANPEQGIGFAFVGGVVIGALLSRLSR